MSLVNQMSEVTFAVEALQRASLLEAENTHHRIRTLRQSINTTISSLTPQRLEMGTLSRHAP